MKRRNTEESPLPVVRIDIGRLMESIAQVDRVPDCESGGAISIIATLPFRNSQLYSPVAQVGRGKISCIQSEQWRGNPIVTCEQALVQYGELAPTCVSFRIT